MERIDINCFRLLLLLYFTTLPSCQDKLGICLDQACPEGEVVEQIESQLYQVFDYSVVSGV